MISILKSSQTYDKLLIEGFCLYADVDDLPTDGIANGSKFEVLDSSDNTLTEYRFDEENGNWVQIGGGVIPV